MFSFYDKSEVTYISGELVLSDFDQSNLRRGYDGKC